MRKVTHLYAAHAGSHTKTQILGSNLTWIIRSIPNMRITVLKMIYTITHFSFDSFLQPTSPCCLRQPIIIQNCQHSVVDTLPQITQLSRPCRGRQQAQLMPCTKAIKRLRSNNDIVLSIVANTFKVPQMTARKLRPQERGRDLRRPRTKACAPNRVATARGHAAYHRS